VFRSNTRASNSVSSNGISSSARRLKRDHKRLMQRWWAAMEHAVSPSSRCDMPPSPGMSRCNLQRRKTPVLEPSTFVLESFDANEWITVLHRQRRSKCRPIAWRGSAMVLPTMDSRLVLRRPINCLDLASVSGQKAHDRMLLCPRNGFRRRPSPEFYVRQVSSMSDDFGSRDFQICRPAGHKAQNKNAANVEKK
jgi:hypothetical protein